jgi:arylsulfatase A-like enzyme
LKAGKGSAYEGGTRVPFIAAWARPDEDNALQRTFALKAGARSAQPILSEDLFPTLLAIGGADGLIPKDHPIDGRDIRDYLLIHRADPKRPLYFHYPHIWGPKGPGYEPHSAFREGDWKVVYFYIPRRWELYNIKDDIGETKDVSGEQPERLADLAERLKRALIAMGAQWATHRDTGKEEPMRTPAELGEMAKGDLGKDAEAPSGA